MDLKAVEWIERELDKDIIKRSILSKAKCLNIEIDKPIS